MWFLDPRSVELVEADYNEKYRYAILSHKWRPEEVIFQDMKDKTKAQLKKGYKKLQKFCSVAHEDKYKYCWMDTCCINKESSAELSEAINSMYKWYQDADVCYAYLDDVGPDESKQVVTESEWFERGWCLQELIAPKDLQFFDANLGKIGTKASLSTTIASKTRIPESILMGNSSILQYSVAQRMSWASSRKTTRIEDQAYCLLGIFEINMPLLYGEGEKAFMRLQTQLIEKSNEHSIFAWPIDHASQTGLLAERPAAFETCAECLALPVGGAPFHMTNRGLQITLQIAPYIPEIYLAKLAIVFVEGGSSWYNEWKIPASGIFLRKLKENDQYARIKHEGYTFTHLSDNEWEAAKPHRHCMITRVEDMQFRPVTCYFRDTTTILDAEYLQAPFHGFFIRDTSVQPLELKGAAWDSATQAFQPLSGKLKFERLSGIFACDHVAIKYIKVGFDFDFNPVCFLATSEGAGSLACAESLADSEERYRRLSERHPDDTGAWSKIMEPPLLELEPYEDPPLRHWAFAFEVEQHPGLWALKADRTGILECQLWRGEAPHAPISSKMASQTDMKVGNFQIRTHLYNGQRTWVIRL